jgi:hypothetical protein
VEAEMIKEELGRFLRESLKLELSEEKTLITHATNEAARFLGYEIQNQQCDSRRDAHNERNVNGRIALRIPEEVIRNRCARYLKGGEPHHRPELLKDDDLEIIILYQQEYRGYVQYYSLAQNIRWLKRLHRTMEVSLLKTLANKHKSTVNKMALKYKATVKTEYGPRHCLEARMNRPGKAPLVARFGGLPLHRNTTTAIADGLTHRTYPYRSELVQRLLTGECEWCGSTDSIEVHHIRKLADLHKPGRRELPGWAIVMARRRRKTLVLCEACHEDVTQGRPLKARPTD